MAQNGKLSVVWLVDAMHIGKPISLSTVQAAIWAAFSHYEIVLVTANPSAVARRFVGADPHIRIIVPSEHGESAALTTGCAAMTGDYVLVIMGSAVPDWHALPALVPFLPGSDVVTVFRVSGEVTAAPNNRNLTPAVLAFLFGITLHDPFNPTRLYRAELLRGLTFVSSGPALNLELIAKARAQGAAVTEVGITGQADTNTDRVSPPWTTQATRLWLHLRGFRLPWEVRRPPVTHAPSEYVVGGITLAAAVWFVRERAMQFQRGRRVADMMDDG